jgi:reactive chlorine resistance protein C
MTTESQAVMHPAASVAGAHSKLLDPALASRFERVGMNVLRYGLVALLVMWGAFKFAEFEAEGIRPLIENSPLLSWLYPLLGVRGTSALIGVVELLSALLISARRWKPLWSAYGSLIAVGTFVVTLSFLITTPGVWDPSNPFGGFLMKDLLLLGAAIASTGEALRAARHT